MATAVELLSGAMVPFSPTRSQNQHHRLQRLPLYLQLIPSRPTPQTRRFRTPMRQPTAHLLHAHQVKECIHLASNDLRLMEPAVVTSQSLQIQEEVGLHIIKSGRRRNLSLLRSISRLSGVTGTMLRTTPKLSRTSKALILAFEVSSSTTAF